MAPHTSAACGCTIESAHKNTHVITHRTQCMNVADYDRATCCSALDDNHRRMICVAAQYERVCGGTSRVIAIAHRRGEVLGPRDLTPRLARRSTCHMVKSIDIPPLVAQLILLSLRDINDANSDALKCFKLLTTIEMVCDLHPTYARDHVMETMIQCQ